MTNTAPTQVFVTYVNPSTNYIAVQENTVFATDTLVANITVVDNDGDPASNNQLSISSSFPGGEFFNIIGNSLYIKAGAAFDYETASYYLEQMIVNDPAVGGSVDASAYFSLSVFDVNEAPTAVAITNALSSIAENTSTTSQLKVADIALADDATGNNVLSLTGADAAKFEIVGQALYIKAGVTLDYESQSSFNVAVVVDDPGVGSSPDATSATYTLSILNGNDAPTGIALTPTITEISEGASTSSATKVADIAIVDDGDPASNNILSLTGADAAKFTIVGNELFLKAGVTLDYETASALRVAVAVDDPAVGSTPDWTSLEFTLGISNANDAPVSVALVSVLASLAENNSTASATKVADIVVSDDIHPDSNNVLAVTGPDGANFEIVGTELYLKAGVALNFETLQTLHVSVTVDDPGVGTAPDATSGVFALQVLDLNEAPTGVTIVPTAANIAENQSTSTHIKVATIAVADDALGSNGLTLTGADSSLFEIVGSDLFLKAGVELDFETKSVYGLAVVVDDAAIGSTPDATSPTLSLSVADVNEAATAIMLTPTVREFAENTAMPVHIKVADIAVTDDALGNNDLLVSGANASLFEITGTELFLKAGVQLDYESLSALDVSVSVDDTTIGNGPELVSSILHLAIADVNELPTDVVITPVVASLFENSNTASRIKVADIVVQDDAQGTNSIYIEGTTDGEKFELDGNSLYLKAGVKLDFKSFSTLTVQVSVDDPQLGDVPDIAGVFRLQINNISPEVQNGTSQNNVLVGGSDIDFLNGLAGNDTLSGSGGNDKLTGGSGRDIMSGGSGADTFDFNALTETGKLSLTRDIIKDFAHLSDRIDLSNLDARAGVAGNQAFHFIGSQGFAGQKAELHYFKQNLAGTANDRTIVEGDINGDGLADFQIQLAGLKTLTVTDFVL